MRSRNTDHAQRESFGLKTSYVAEFGNEGGPTIAILSEYDALPGVGQPAATTSSRRQVSVRRSHWRNSARGCRAACVISARRRKNASAARKSWRAKAHSTAPMRR